MATWFETEQALPSENEAIQFTIGGRGVPLHGLYHLGTFRSRWWNYGAGQVRHWRAVDLADAAMEWPI